VLLCEAHERLGGYVGAEVEHVVPGAFKEVGHHPQAEDVVLPFDGREEDSLARTGSPRLKRSVEAQKHLVAEPRALRARRIPG
jgi:hypothetical protein